MNDKQISRLERQLERLVENAFTSLFRKSVSAHDIAIKLARSMATHARVDSARMIAPNRYAIHLNPRICEHLQATRPTLPDLLSQHVLELATQSNYDLASAPTITLVQDARLDVDDVEVYASHTEEAMQGTSAMQPIDVAPIATQQATLQLGDKIINLTQTVTNIGRSDDNHIVIDDPFSSRHHVQIRVRFGIYTLFDVDSKSGTLVNNVPVHEHRLQGGDVIRIGNTLLIFMLSGQERGTMGTTDMIDPVSID